MELQDCLQALINAYLEGVRSISTLIDLFGAWIHQTHETLIPFKAGDNTTVAQSTSPNKKSLLVLPKGSASQSFEDVAEEAGRNKVNNSLLERQNKRHLDVFMSTGESFLASLEAFLEVLQYEDDERYIAEMLGPKVKLIKAEHQLFILTLAQICLKENHL